MSEATKVALLRVLRVLALSDTERVLRATSVPIDDEVAWFLENIDDLAPGLHECGWVNYVEFTRQPGQVVVTTGKGDARGIVITRLGWRQLNAAVAG